jgi:hypothetical protein
MSEHFKVNQLGWDITETQWANNPELNAFTKEVRF